MAALRNPEAPNTTSTSDITRGGLQLFSLQFQGITHSVVETAFSILQAKRMLNFYR